MSRLYFYCSTQAKNIYAESKRAILPFFKHKIVCARWGVSPLNLDKFYPLTVLDLVANDLKKVYYSSQKRKHYEKRIFTLLAIGITCLVYAFSERSDHTLSDVELALKQEHSPLWEKLEKYGITPDRIEKLIQEHQEFYQKEIKKYEKQMCCKEPLSAPLLKVVDEVLADFGFKSNEINILSYTFESPAASHEHGLFINEAILGEFSLKAQRFLIAHELIHILHNDSIRAFVIELYARKNPAQSLSDLLIEYSQYCEKRADICASLKSPQYAQGYLDFMNAVLADEQADTYQDAAPSHPQDRERLEIAQNIVNMVNSTAALAA